MTIGGYIRRLRAHRMLVITSIVGCMAVAGAIAWMRTPIYEAKAQLFVSAKGSSPAAPGLAYEGGLFAQQRARSYAEIISSPRGAQAVIEQLGLPQSVDAVQEKIRAFVPPDTHVINLAVRDPSPQLAKSIADSLEDQLPGLVEELETPEGSEFSPVQVTVTRPARVPEDPVSPRKPIYLALGALLGLALGVGGAVLRYAHDRRIRSDADASVTVGAPVLGRIAEHRGKGMVQAVVGGPLPARGEGYQGLRANLRALSAEHDLRSFIVSSAVPAEGKTDVVANLGIALAQAGERVVVVDANLRSPRLGERLGVSSSAGLTDLLEARQPIMLTLRRHASAPLSVLTSGTPRPNPGQLLDSEALGTVLDALTDWFDYVIVDAPALLSVADAANLARHASAVILVVRAASTNTHELEAAREALRAVDGRLLGVVLNRVRESENRLYREDPLPPRRIRSRPVTSVRSDGQGNSEWSP